LGSFVRNDNTLTAESFRDRLVLWLGPLIAAVQFLTRVPVFSSLGYREEDLARSPAWFPVVGAWVGGSAAVIALLLSQLSLAPAVVAALVVVAGLLLTGALPEHGLSDTADGLGAWTREDALRAMREPRVATYGVLALLLAVGLRWVFLSGMQTSQWGWALVISGMLSRWSQVFFLWLLPYARSGSTGVASVLGRSMTWKQVGIATLVTVVLTVVLVPKAAVLAVAATLALTALLGWAFLVWLGGFTGDTLGALSVLVELLVLFVFVWLHPAIQSAWVP
jgi:adenosylcobinamide-GDP ribazoletransferase